MASIVRCPTHPDTPAIGQCTECGQVFCSQCAHFSEERWFCSEGCVRSDSYKRLGIQLQEARLEIELHNTRWKTLTIIVSIVNLVALAGFFISMIVIGASSASRNSVFGVNYAGLFSFIGALVMWLVIFLPCTIFLLVMKLTRQRKLSDVSNLEIQLRQFVDEEMPNIRL